MPGAARMSSDQRERPGETACVSAPPKTAWFAKPRNPAAGGSGNLRETWPNLGAAVHEAGVLPL